MTVDDQGAGHLTYDEPDYGDEVGVHVTGRSQAAGSASPFGGERHPDPCSLVMFGVTGDLAHRKLIPALYDLGCHGVLPFGTTLVGYGRQEMTDDQFRDLMRTAIDDYYGEEVVDGALCERLLQAPRYVQGQFDDPEGFKRLAVVLDELDRQGARGNRMFYLATPPSQFDVLIEQLGEAGLARRGAFDAGRNPDGTRGWTRVVIEKPFGRDLETARELDRVIGRGLRRAAGLPHRPLPGQGDRAEPAGPALRQRHLRAGVEPALRGLRGDHGGGDPGRRAPRPVLRGGRRAARHDHAAPHPAVHARRHGAAGRLRRRRRARREDEGAARGASRSPPQSVGDWAVRAQYVQGRVDGEDVPAYRAEERVAPDSCTETYAALKLVVDNWRWQGVPFYVRTGKRLARRVTEIAIHFKRPPVALFRDAQAGGGLQPNVLVLRVQPDEGFSLTIESKQPGHSVALQPVAMDFSYGVTLHELPFSAYETVLVDAMEGDMTLFTRGDQAEEAWRIVGPVLEAWAKRPERDISIYEAGSWGPEAADALIARDGHSWRRPMKGEEV